jgi:hypothetical protein
VLVVYLTSEVVSSGTNFLTKKVTVPSWDIIEKKGGSSVS